MLELDIDELLLELELETTDELAIELELDSNDELAIELDIAELLDKTAELLDTDELATELLVVAVTLDTTTGALLEAFEDIGAGSNGRELDCTAALLLEANALVDTFAWLELLTSTLEDATDFAAELTGFGATEDDIALLLEEGGSSLALSLLPPPPPHALNTRLSDRTDNVLSEYKAILSMMILLGLRLKSFTCQLQVYFSSLDERLASKSFFYLLSIGFDILFWNMSLLKPGLLAIYPQ